MAAIQNPAGESMLEAHQNCKQLYDEGVPLYTKAHIRDIEDQLRDPETNVFTLNRIDGNTTTQGVQPRPGAMRLVDFFTYQEMVQDTMTSRPFPYCSYAVTSIYRQQSQWDKPGGVPQPDDIARHVNGNQAVPALGLNGMSTTDRTYSRWHSAFQGATMEWENSKSCQRLQQRLARAFEIVPAQWAKINKIVCFALGEPSNDIQPRMMQHAMITTIADMISERFGTNVRKLTQDPGYSEITKDCLRIHGFGVIDTPGLVSGYLEIDNNSIVVSIYLPQPIKQMIADLARPLMIITNAIIPDTPENRFIERDALKFAESPRTREMWQDYYNESIFVREADDRNFRSWSPGLQVMWREVHPKRGDKKNADPDPDADDDDDDGDNDSIAGSERSYDDFVPAPPEPDWV
ncbi:hypothetical protein F4810DRAFT_708740 [Camillea tinctor]|nr:hypothetical protein F4810DRAFT_708740 [Camillea tinctor]